jgi:uncharacterized protein with gpF-like domain
LLTSLQDKKAEVERNVASLIRILPQLRAKQQSKEGKEEAEIYVGMEGLATIFNQETGWMRKTRGISYVIGATKGGKAGRQIDDFFKRLQAKRDMVKVRTKFIFNERMKGKFPYLERSPFCNIRYIESGSEMTSINVFGNKTVIAVYSAQPFLFVIQSTAVANDFKAYFEVLWKQGKK